MDISFRSAKLAKQCNSIKELRREFGDQCAKKIAQRLLDLRAATTLADVGRLPPARCHELTAARSGEFAVDVKQPYRLIFVPEHDPVPRKADGGIDLGQVTAITVIGVEDYHG